ncbi:MAG: alpha/beta hydrolase domain-containing protein [Verrucomicrobiales bacterium]|nr:alpha/beta hydrolase domain-containing protein [Verrucomicrobiales bacterium]
MIRILCLTISIVSFSTTLFAEVTRFEILTREDFAGGKSFGETGVYERIAGKVHFELDPTAEANATVVDLDLAPRNERGHVELSADLFILAPKDMSKGNGALLYDVNNRGNLLALRYFCNGKSSNAPETEAHAGDGFLLKQGFTLVWSGWDGELLPGNRLRLYPPVVADAVTGKVRCEIVPSSDTKKTVINWSNHGSYRPTKQGLETATLTHRLLPGHPRVPIPRDQWSLTVTEIEDEHPGQLPKIELDFPAGLKKANIYEVIYEAQDPVVMGTGFTSVRDLISALRHGSGANNPLPSVARTYGFGVSQSGRFLRELVHGGFNSDESGRKVFDGIMPHVSGSGMGSFNHRFAQPTRHVGQHDHHDYPPDRFPFAYGTQTDPLSGQTDGIFKRALENDTAPLVFHTQSSSEYWNRSGSLVHTDPLGQQDADIPENVRIYFFGGTQHGPAAFPPTAGAGQTPGNPGNYKPLVRALLVALDRWNAEGKSPPPSRYPTIRDGNLVAWTQNATGFPDIPGIRYPGVIQQPSWLDFGPRWKDERIVDFQPPLPRGDYRVLVPRSDADGNDVGCLPPPEVAVPVATYASWRLRREDAGAGNQLLSLNGSYIPFPQTREEREKTGDPRLSVEERYGSVDGYLEKLEALCRDYVRQGYLLEQDIAPIVETQKNRVEPLFAESNSAGQDAE